MVKSARELGDKKPRPHAVAGDQLRAAREARGIALKGIAESLNISIGRYQNWEAGYNRPSPQLWGLLSSKLGVDVGSLYGAPSAQHIGEKTVSAKVVLSLIESIERNLETLRIMCSETPTKRPHSTAVRTQKQGKRLAA